MNISNNDSQIGFVLEQIDDHLKAILEGQDALSTVPKQLQNIDDRLVRVEDEVTAIKATVTD
jgi:conjugal transfer/entry exclusion protein